MTDNIASPLIVTVLWALLLSKQTSTIIIKETDINNYYKNPFSSHLKNLEYE